MRAPQKWRIYLLILFSTSVVSCEQRNTRELLIGNWKMVKKTPNAEMPPPPFRFLGVGFDFINDSIVDTKIRYYKITRSAEGQKNLRFVGTLTKYKIENDSLKFFDRTDSVWTQGKYLSEVSDDSLILENSDGHKLRFFRNNYENVKRSDFNVIALSTSGCYGTCPIINIIIDSSGHVIFFGERYVEKIGFYEGEISVEHFEKIKSEFDKAGIEQLDQYYYVTHTDDETISTTFVRDSTIVNSVVDYGEAGPIELVWAYTAVRYLFQDIKLKALETSKMPFYLDLHYLGIEKEDSVYRLTQSESFLLWNYLRKGSIVQTKIDTRYDLTFVRNEDWFLAYDQTKDSSGRNAKTRVRNITSDGRHYTFNISGQKPVTVDIGFNYIESNKRFLKFTKVGNTK